jgi:hypothetical protein
VDETTLPEQNNVKKPAGMTVSAGKKPAAMNVSASPHLPEAGKYGPPVF